MWTFLIVTLQHLIHALLLIGHPCICKHYLHSLFTFSVYIVCHEWLDQHSCEHFPLDHSRYMFSKTKCLMNNIFSILYKSHIRLIFVYDFPYPYQTTQKGFFEDVTSFHFVNLLYMFALCSPQIVHILSLSHTSTQSTSPSPTHT